jgi:hypothetical protein
MDAEPAVGMLPRQQRRHPGAGENLIEFARTERLSQDVAPGEKPDGGLGG